MSTSIAYSFEFIDWNGGDAPETCQWFALCDEPAAYMVSHPVLDWVPTCDRCTKTRTEAVITDPAKEGV